MKKILYKWYKNFIHAKRDRKYWDERIRLVTESADNTKIRKVANAGIIKDGFQIMHNGQRILTGSYYGKPISRMLKINKGVHEPQEEFAFQEIIAQLPENPTMIELGAYWGFYSMWLKQIRPSAKVYLAEPELENLQMGINNFLANKLEGIFIHAGIGIKNSEGVNGAPIFSVDEIIANYNIPFIEILHADIQGYEMQMLQGSLDAIKENKIGYFFVSTHSMMLHQQCINFFEAYNYKIICEADLNATYSYDGLIVAKSHHFAGINEINISKRN